jgi:hypothetical protein
VWKRAAERAQNDIQSDDRRVCRDRPGIFASLNIVALALFLHLGESAPHGFLGLGRSDLSADQSTDLARAKVVMSTGVTI